MHAVMIRLAIPIIIVVIATLCIELGVAIQRPPETVKMKASSLAHHVYGACFYRGLTESESR
jgi:hypothetical protein